MATALIYMDPKQKRQLARRAKRRGRIQGRTEQGKLLADTYRDVDRRLLPIEAKFELIEKVATQGPRRVLPAKTGS
jgi:hypothetical protein